MKKAQFYKKLDHKKVQCVLCPHQCTIVDKGRGICGVRENRNGELYSLVYGHPLDFHIDPIEKKPLYHFYPGRKILSFGTFGCNFACDFCQNWDISQYPKISRPYFDSWLKYEEELGDWVPEIIENRLVSEGIKMVAYTYTEPTIFYEFALDAAQVVHEIGGKNVFVTNGYINPKPLKKIAPFLDAANVDLKAFDQKFYTKHVKGELKYVLRAIELYLELGIWLELTTLLIPGENDSTKELKKLAKYISSLSPGIPWHISRFHPDYKLMDKLPTEKEKLLQAYQIGKEAGLNYVYIGNAPTLDKVNTYCPKCSKLLIDRLGYSGETIGLKVTAGKARCKYCQTKIAGSF